MKDQGEYERIEKSVEEKLGFYIHVAAYVVINAFLIALNMIMTPQYNWFFWPLIGWGIGLLFHGLGVLVSGEGTAIRERMIDQEMQKPELKP